MLNVEQVDLAAVVRALHERFGGTLDEDYLDGRTLIRDALARHLDCSELEAEELVDTLESREYLRFPTNLDETHPSKWSRWYIGVPRAEQ